MHSPRWTLLVIPVVAAALTGATCTKAANDTPQTGSVPKPESGVGGSGATTSPESPKALLTGIPGMDFSALNDGAKRELATVFTDEFCYCGCPHTLGACLKTHASCKHAKRMALLAATEVSAGQPATAVVNTLS
ncbi:MAG: DsbA family protein, partial [Myxococcaceae bacterium]